MRETTDWNRKDCLAIEGLSRTELEVIFGQAKALKKALLGSSPFPSLEGKTLVNLFLEPSTRTRIAFEVAAKRLGMEVISIAADSSSRVKGETLADMARTINALQADAIVIRHSCAGAAHYLSRILPISVINAGDGAHEHPTQALLDCFTLREHLGDLRDKHITILGDILFSRVARSNIWLLKQLGAHVTLAGPTTLVPSTFSQLGVRVCHNLKEALSHADALMLLRIQHERQSTVHFPSLREYTRMFGLNGRRSAWLKPNALIMHPGPINRGIEIDSDLADSSRSVILEQVTNGVLCRMAVLLLCLTLGHGEANVLSSPKS